VLFSSSVGINVGISDAVESRSVERDDGCTDGSFFSAVPSIDEVEEGI